MINRATALSFILLANIILFTHAVIPHYHHNNEISLTGFHYQKDSHSHKHRSTEHRHNHDGENKAEYCVLKQVAIVPSNYVKQEGKCFNCIANYYDFDGFQAVLFDSGLSRYSTQRLSNVLFSPIASLYSRFTGSNHGLRAPPIV